MGKKGYNELSNDYSALKRLHDALVLSVENMNTAMDACRAENAFYKAQLQNADRFVMIQKQITIDNLNQSREVHDNLVAEIIELKNKLKG